MLFSEPKIPQPPRPDGASRRRRRFQCSSASRKFLNPRRQPDRCVDNIRVSVLFSEPKIPQLCVWSGYRAAHKSFSALQRAENSSTVPVVERATLIAAVSVLFSEPKIPQPTRAALNPPRLRSFSALQRAENSSTLRLERAVWRNRRFQCSSASRKFLNPAASPDEPPPRRSFSALQRAENSSTPTLAPASIHIPDCDDHASSFLSLPGASP